MGISLTMNRISKENLFTKPYEKFFHYAFNSTENYLNRDVFCIKYHYFKHFSGHRVHMFYNM